MELPILLRVGGGGVLLAGTLEPSVVRLRRATVIQERGVFTTAVTLLLRGVCAG